MSGFRVWVVAALGATLVVGAGCDCGGPGGQDAGPDAGPPCPPNQIRCDGACVSPRVDPAHCGGCGNACTGTAVCSAGVCADNCQAPLTACSNRCVDTRSDNQHCGTCTMACDAGAGEGCVNGTCQPGAVVLPDPAKCVNGGPAIFVGDGGARDCAGNIAQVTFRWAVCSCNNIQLSSQTHVDGFDSTRGPYDPAAAGIGAGIGSNGSFSSSSRLFAGGALWAAGANGILNAETTVKQDLRSGGRWTLGPTTVEGDAYVKGNITSGSASTVAGTLYQQDGGTLTGPLIAQRVLLPEVSVPPPCDCSAAQLVPVAAIVAQHAAENDNALVGLDAGLLGPGSQVRRLDLPCGHYYLSEIQAGNPVTINARGNTALYVGGDIDVGSALTITLEPTAQFDVFVGGGICNSGGLTLGSPNYPAQMRVYVGGTNACGQGGRSVMLTSGASVAANIFAGYGSYETSSPTLYYGSIFADSVSLTSSNTIHYDRAVLAEAKRCPAVPPADAGQACSSCRDCGNGACTSGQCGPCATSADCCAPLICNAGACEPAACTPPGQSCQSRSACCAGMDCVGDAGVPCPAGSTCTCEVVIN